MIFSKRWMIAAIALLPFASPAAPPDTEAVEFYNSGTGHFFVTASAAEAASVDSGGAGPDWVRTGRSFQAWLMAADAPPDAQPVCRFYSTSANSHFYTAGAGECQSLRSMQAQESAATGKVLGWQYEGIAFYIQVPKAAGCAAGTTQLTRVYNDGFATGAGSNHRFVDDAALQDLMVDESWIAEGTAFCAVAKSTGSNANLPPTTTNFDALVGTWQGNGEWDVETGMQESESSHPLTLTFAADGSLAGSGNGCSFTGQAILGDGFRSFFTATVTAAGCTDAAFNGDYTRVGLQRFGADMLLARLRKGDDANEVSITARLSNGAATPTAGPPAGSFDRVVGEWVGTVGWSVEASGQPEVEVNKAIDLTIAADGTLTGTGNGCTITGMLVANAADPSSFTGTLTAAGCTDAAFNGTFDRARVQREASRLRIDLERESAGVEVEVQGTLLATGSVATPPNGMPPATPPATPPAAFSLVGTWQGTVGWFASQQSSGKDDKLPLASAVEPITFTIGADGSFTGSGFGCAFTGSVSLAFDGEAAGGGQVTASGCTKDVFNGAYTAPRFERDDAALEIDLEREMKDATGAETRVKISGKVAKQ
jgi:hypothetical protein